MDWVNGFIIPLIKVVFLFGIIGTILFFVGKGFWNAWSRQTKFFFKYKVMRKSYPEKTLKWILDCMDKGIGWYDAKKTLMIKNYPTDQINEILWIYDQVINEFNNQKGNKFISKRGAKNVEQDLPTISS